MKSDFVNHRALSLVLGLLLVPGAHAQTVSTWTAANPADGTSFVAWNSTTAWSTAPTFPNNGQPAAGDTYRAVINKVAGQAAGPRVDLNRTVTLSQFDFSDGRIRSNIVANPLRQITVNGPFNWTGGMLDESCTTLVNGGMTIGQLAGAAPTLVSGHRLTNAAGQTATHAAGTLQFANTGEILQDDGFFQNNGTFLVTGGAGMDDLSSSELENKFLNAGTFICQAAAGATYQADVFFENTGAVNVTSGTLELGRGGSTTGGSCNVSTGATLRFRGPQTFSAAAAFTGGGQVALGGDVQLFGALADAFTFAGGLDFGGNLWVRRGTVTLQDSAVLGSVLFTSGSLAFPATETFTTNGLLTLETGSINGGGKVIAAGGLRLPGGSATLNGGELHLPAGQTARSEFTGRLTLAGGARFINSGTVELTGSNGISGNIVNDGTLRRTTATSSTAIGTVTNRGAISVESGGLQLALTSIGGTHTVAAGATMYPSGTFDAASSVGGQGMYEYSLDTTTFACPYNVPGTTRVTFASVTFEQPATLGTYQQDSGSDLEGTVIFRKPASIGSLTFGKGFLNFEDTANIGTLTATFGNFDSRIHFLRSTTLAAPATVTGNGLTMAAGQTLTFQSLFNCVSGTLDGGGTFTTPGGIAMTGNGTLDAATLVIPAGATGTITGSGSVSWLFYNSAALDNRGTFLAQNNHTFSRNTAGDNSRILNSGTFTRETSTGTFTSQIPFQNTGTVNVNSGRLTLTSTFTQTAGTFRLGGGAVTKSGGALIFQGGTLTGAGTITGAVDMQGGTLAPGNGIGTLVITSNVTLGSGTTVAVEIGGATQGTEHDFLSKTGGSTLTLAGNLSVTLANGFQNTITPAQTFTVLTSNSNLAGSFANVASGARLQTADGLGSFIVTYAGTRNVVLTSYQANPVAPPNGRITVFSATPTQATLSWAPFGTGTTYQVQTSTTMTTPASWTSLGPPVTGGNTTTTVTHPGGPRRYFRVVVP